MSLVPKFEFHARACDQLGSPLYAALLSMIARDIEGCGPCADMLSRYRDASWRAAVPLRFMAAVHALVLSGAAPALAPYYPSTAPRPSSRADVESVVWPVFLDVVTANPEWVRDFLGRPPQTNEVGRAVPLLAGLLAAVDATPMPVRLLELGSSAGLNLRADQFRWDSTDIGWGPIDSPVALDNAWQGAIPGWLTGAVRRHPEIDVVERRGCDPNPLDPRSPRDALALRSYVWPDQLARAARLDGALRIAERVPAEIVAVGAAEFLADVAPEPGTLTVVWHSVMRQYVPDAEWTLVTRELDRLAATSRPNAGFAYIAFEPPPGPGDGKGFRLTARFGSTPSVELARAEPHGIPAFAEPVDDTPPSAARPPTAG